MRWDWPTVTDKEMSLLFYISTELWMKVVISFWDARFVDVFREAELN